MAAAKVVVLRHGNRTLAFADIEVGDHVQARGQMDETTLRCRRVSRQPGAGKGPSLTFGDLYQFLPDW